MDIPVEAGAPGVATSVLHLGTKVLLGFSLGLTKSESLSDVVEVVVRAQLRDSSLQHHGEEVDENGRSPAKDEEGFLAQGDESEGGGGHTSGGGFRHMH